MQVLNFVVLLSVLAVCQAHMTIWAPSMWGIEQNPTTAWMAQPLQDYNYSNWWMHGTKTINLPPPAGVYTNLPAGGSIDMEITGNKWSSSLAVPQGGPGLCSPTPGKGPRNPPEPWDNGMNGNCNANIHAPKRSDVAACALAIAYKTDIHAVNPEDFVVFSVSYDCIARSLQTFDIPALPACPASGCVCSWFWIHNSIGGTDQMYMSPFRCQVSNPSKNVLGKPVPPVRCDGKQPYRNGPTTTICNKVQQPMYWANTERNNMLNPVNTQCAPNYTAIYGFPDGAQHSIFTNALPTIGSSIGDTLFSDGASFIGSSPFSILVTPSLDAGSKLTVQGDGNIVFADVSSNQVHWTSNTAGKGVAPYKLTLQQDGNLVLRDSQSTVLWATNTAGQGVGPYKLKVRDVHSIKLVDSNGEPLWAASTY